MSAVSHQVSSPAEQPLPPERATRGAGRGNAFLASRMAGRGRPSEPPRGPFGRRTNELLAQAFGRDLGGIDARFDQGQRNRAVGAVASTEGHEMAFDAPVRDEALTPDLAELLAHEVAHALAGSGTGETDVDGAGDPGEARAERAGEGFRRWAETGFEGPAPQLAPATGGRARVHRVASGATTVDGSPMLRKGDTGSLVSALQSLLNTKGADLDVDGIFGSLTDAAVRSFQRANGLEVDGIVGPKTAAKLNDGGSTSSAGTNSGSDTSRHTVTGSPLLSKGDTGPLVEALQELLNGKGAHLDVDGQFGSLTDAAVRGFQSANGLEVDGVVGPKTAAKLNAAGSEDIASGGSEGSGGSYAGNDAYDDMRDAVLAAARSHLGAPYYWGADGPSMFDCSGFVLYVLRQDTGLINWGDDTAAGIKGRLPSTTNPQPGDLNFYTGSSGVSHVEMYTGNGDQEIGASGGGSSTYGNDPDAKVQYSYSSADSRTLSHGSIAGLIAAKS